MKKALLCTLGLLGMAVSAQAALYFNDTFDTGISGWAGVNAPGGGTDWNATTGVGGGGGLNFQWNGTWVNKTGASATGLAGTAYTLEFDVIGNPDAYWSGTLYHGGGTLQIWAPNSPAANAYTPTSPIVVGDRDLGAIHYTYSGTFSPTMPDGPLQVYLNMTGNPGWGFTVDNYQLTVVPEPLALTSFGSIGLLALARRKRS